jgi:hypothetical protein
LLKHNLLKRKWTGCQKYCFCDENENIDHLFIFCPFAKLIWRMVFFSYNIPPPSNITNMFGNWLNGVPKKDKEHIRIGVSAICWSIWTSSDMDIRAWYSRTAIDMIFGSKVVPVVYYSLVIRR